jgi:Gnt-I system high-affinity gluconate transporter
MVLLPIVVAVVLLILLIAAGRVPPFVGFIIAALVAALLLGMPLAKIPGSIEHGVGDLLGSLAGVIVLGAMFGKLIADSGAAQRIAESLIGLFGQKRLPIAMTATGFIVGVPLFYNVGFVLMVPLVFSISHRARLPAIYAGMPLFAGLSIAHGFLPPHPSPTALVAQFGADLGLTLIYGLAVGIPTLLIAGPLFAMTLRRIEARPSALFKPIDTAESALPGTFNSFACALLPVVLIAGTTALNALPTIDPTAKTLLAFVGNPMIVLLLSLAIATVALGTMRGMALRTLMDGFRRSGARYRHHPADHRRRGRAEASADRQRRGRAARCNAGQPADPSATARLAARLRDPDRLGIGHRRRPHRRQPDPPARAGGRC